MRTASPPDASAWQALRRRRFLMSRWPWRALLHTVATSVVWAAFMIPALAVIVPVGAAIDRLAHGQVVAAAALLLLGLALGGVLLPLLASPLIALDRWRARLVDPTPLPRSPRPPADPAHWLRDRWLTATRWRETGYLVAVLTLESIVLAGVSLFGTSAVVLMAAPFLASRDDPINVGAWHADGPASALLVAVLGVLLLVVVVYGWTAGACLQVGLLRRTLDAHRSEALAEELTRVDASRTRLLESFESERRRIERDLHDGAQQRLVTLAMGLGVTRLEVVDALGADHPAAAGVATAHEQAKVLMDELRAFVRGIHPKVLTDVGLVAALDQLTADLPLPVAVSSSLDRRPASAVESAAYFAASEALTNVVRHSHATCATVSVSRVDGEIVVEVTDDGHGGAMPRPDSGLTWMADRLAAVDGTLEVSSPPGGPTVVRMRIAEPR
ncbi:sensor histidine kinase [Nocardioides panacisoli]|uniref:histidine kinase n=1 Tax=Nocardioides panacisoli TaxID=627624 RepID=A0ABP7I098_9ACTN